MNHCIKTHSKKFILLQICLLSFLFSQIGFSQIESSKDYQKLSWKQVANQMPEDWYASNEAKTVADSVLKYQTEIGGWPKNSDLHNGKINREEFTRIKASGIGATFDNGATTREMYFLAKIFSYYKDERYKTAFLKGFDYILKAQYDNGGWPQFYPYRKGDKVSYNSHITFNDNAMLNVLIILRKIMNETAEFSSLQISPEQKRKAKEAFEKGIDCILKTQIIKHGKPTIWCAQHDEVTLAPANARAYELASFSGAESVGITLLLMEIEKPSKEIINAINGSINWFESHKIEGIRVNSFINSKGEKDREIVEDKTAPALLARFYDLETELPFFCDRDGIKRKTFAELGYDRRNGYSWYTDAPKKLFEKYEVWKAK